MSPLRGHQKRVDKMKCITYVSKVVARQNGAVIPTGLSEVFRVARKRNTTFDITGVLSYRNGHYIQVLEGEAAAVTQLYANIIQDPRHQKVTKVLELSINERSFPRWDMKLLQSVDKDADFAKFVSKYSSEISALDQNQNELFRIFYDTKTDSARFTLSYTGKDLMLLAWPDFTAIKPSPIIIELCARLTNTQYPYAMLLEGREFGTQQQLDKILNKLEALDILRVTDSIHHSDAKMQSNSSIGFYSKMKNFLGLR